MKLYEIAERYKNIMDIESEIDEDTFLMALDVIEDDLKVKVDSIANLIYQNTSEAEFYAKKIDELKKAKKTIETRNKWLNGYLTEVLDDLGVKKYQTDNHVFSTRNYRASTVITNEDKLPVEYKKVVEEIKIDKTAIYKALKDGSEVPGAHLEPNRKTVIK